MATRFYVSKLWNPKNKLESLSLVNLGVNHCQSLIQYYWTVWNQMKCAFWNALRLLYLFTTYSIIKQVGKFTFYYIFFYRYSVCITHQCFVTKQGFGLVERPVTKCDPCYGWFNSICFTFFYAFFFAQVNFFLTWTLLSLY